MEEQKGFSTVQMELDIMLKYGEAFKVYRGDNHSLIIQVGDMVFCCDPEQKFFSVGLPDENYQGQTFLLKNQPQKSSFVQ